MFNHYFNDWDVKPEFSQENITLWSTWLGKTELHLLDEVSEGEWLRFNSLIKRISKAYRIGLVDCEAGSIIFHQDIKNTLNDYSTSMSKDASVFSKYIIPELECVLTEEWDYTYILWHKRNGAVEALSPYIKKSGLKHFSGRLS